jgi:hypothetical protein
MMNKIIKRRLIINRRLLKIALTSTNWLLLQMINTIIAPSIILKTTTIIESMIEKAVPIDITTEDPLLPPKEEEEKEVVTDTMISITGKEITTNKSTT